jgi:hypothetical protein
MSGSTLTACDTWATLNVLQLQKSCPLRDLNLRPLEQNWSVLTTKKRINLCYIGAFTSFYQWNAINAINKPKLQKKLPLWDLNLRPFEQNWSALTTKTRINLCYIGVFTSFYQWNTINPVNKPKLQKVAHSGIWTWDLWDKIEVHWPLRRKVICVILGFLLLFINETQ